MATGQENRDNHQSGMAQGGAGAQAGPEWDALKGEVGGMAETAMEQGRHFLDSAKEQATGYVDDRKNELAEAVVGLAGTLRQSGSAFDNRPAIRAIVESAAGGIEQLADDIRSRSFRDIFGGVEDMVRRRPAAAAVATMAAGFLLSRFVKASSEGTSGAGQRTSGSGPGSPQTHGSNPAPLQRSRAASGGGI